MIVVKNLCKKFGEKVILDNLSFSIAEKESFVVIGGSGVGKSILSKIILGLVQPDTGSVSICGEEITWKDEGKRPAILSECSMLFQGGALFDSMTVWENISFGLPHTYSAQKKRDLAIEKLKAVNLDTSVAFIYPSELSGGMQKRVALARAIATNPKVIFFDEPTTGLDPIVSRTINALILKCVREIGATAITITHDLGSLQTIADRVALLRNGKFLWSGTKEEMNKTTHPAIVEFLSGKVSAEQA